MQERHQAVWLGERVFLAQRRLEDIYISECAERYPAETRQGVVAQTHRLIVLRTGPAQLGFPVRRVRAFGVGLNLQSLVWTGPDLQKDQQQLFDALFNRPMELTGHIYFCADDNMVHSYAESRAKKRRKILPHGRLGG
eukprot:461289-Lingulodinium_polyedra.AAC.1